MQLIFGCSCLAWEEEEMKNEFYFGICKSFWCAIIRNRYTSLTDKRHVGLLETNPAGF